MVDVPFLVSSTADWIPLTIYPINALVITNPITELKSAKAITKGGAP